MQTIYIQIREKTASAVSPPTIICGNSDYTVAFTFDAEWDGYTAKTARFVYYKNGILMYEDVLFEGTSVTVPILHDINEVKIGVYAGDLHTTTYAVVQCEQSITDGAAVHSDPQPDVYAQLLEYLSGLQGGGAAAGRTALLLNGNVSNIAGKTIIAEEET